MSVPGGLWLSVCLSVCLYPCLPVPVSVRVSVSLCLYPSVCLYLWLFVCPLPCALPGCSRRQQDPPESLCFVAGNCGPLPQLPGAEPPEDFKDQQSFSIGSKVTYRCVQGFAKLPSKSDTTQCLENARWSVLPEFCDRE